MARRSCLRVSVGETDVKRGVQPVQPVQPPLETFQKRPLDPLYPLFIKKYLYRDYRLDRLDFPVVP